MDDVRQHVRLFIEQYERDGLMYTDCPSCNKPNKLMIGPADEGGHWFKCLSAGCATFGTTGEYVPKPGRNIPVPGTSRKIYPSYHRDPKFKELSTDRYRFLATRFHLSGRSTRILCTGEIERRYVFPVYSPDGPSRGYVARSYDTGESRKALLRPYEDIPTPMVSWYWPKHRRNSYRSVVLVEDQVSAARLGMYMPCVALLGTSISTPAAEEIRRVGTLYGVESTVVLLDNDACTTAERIADFFHNGKPIPLFDDDVKDMHPAALDELIEVLRG